MIRNGDVFFLGPGGSGKTHTLAALLGEDPPSTRESTPCAKKPIRSIAHCKVGVNGLHFTRITDDEYSDMVSSSARQLQAEQSTKCTTALSTVTDFNMIRSAAGYDSFVVSSAVSSSNVGDSIPKQAVSSPNKQQQQSEFHQSGLRIELLRRMQAVSKTTEHLDDKDLFNMRDSGGQPMFHEVLPLFVKNTTFGILTVKLNEALDSHPLVEYYSSGKPVGEPFKSPFTHLQTFRHCMRVLQSTCDCNTRPKLIFVGTHKDLEHECTLIENRQVKNQKLKKIIPPGVKDSIIYCDDSLKELLIAVNVKTPGGDDKKTICDIRKMMIKELQRLPKRRIPLRYFALEMAFLRLGKYQHKAVLSKEECFKEAAAYHFSKESFDAALKYLHSLKLIFYYEEVLPDVIFIDAQALLDKITELVEYSLSLQSSHIQKIPVTGNLEEFKAYGIISQELLSQFRSHYVHDLFTEKELILLFKYLWVIAEVYQGKYLMPCLLRVDSSPFLLSVSTVIPPLLFYFGPNGPKLGIYCFLLASLITDAKWELMSEYDHPVQLSRNQVQFVLPGENPGCITITDSFSTFFHVGITFPEDVTSTDASKICEDICPKIRETILIGIRNASLKLNYSYCESTPKVAFLCTKHFPTDLHPATVSLSSALLTCTAQRASVCCKLTECHRLWLGKDRGGKQ